MQANHDDRDGDATTPTEAAQLAHHEHQQMIEAIMMLVDTVHHVQTTTDRVNVEHLRQAVARKFRRSAEMHSVCLAFLLSDFDEDYARELEAYADEIRSDDQDDEPAVTRDQYLAMLRRRLAAARAEGRPTADIERLLAMAGDES